MEAKDTAANPSPSPYADSLSRLNRHLDQIPMGWQALYVDLRFTLYCIETPARAATRIDGAWEEDGLLHVQSDSADRVVQGVLRKARVRAMHTCSVCGKRGKLRQLDEWREATLCGSCAGPRLLKLQIARLLGLDRCGAVDLRQEIRSSPNATLVRAAAEATGAACELPNHFVTAALDADRVREWLRKLEERLQEESSA